MNNLNRRDFMKKTFITGAAFSVVPRFVMGGNGYTAPGDENSCGDHWYRWPNQRAF